MRLTDCFSAALRPLEIAFLSIDRLRLRRRLRRRRHGQDASAGGARRQPVTRRPDGGELARERDDEDGVAPETDTTNGLRSYAAAAVNALSPHLATHL